MALIETWRKHIEEPARAAGYSKPHLEVIHSPYRTLFQPILDYIKSVQAKEPERLIAVIIPQLIQPRWWEYLLHNQVATALKAMLLLNGNDRVVVINTPWFLKKEQ